MALATASHNLDSSCRGVEASEVASPQASVIKEASCKPEKASALPEKQAKRKESGGSGGKNVGCVMILLTDAKKLLHQAQQEVTKREEKVKELEARLAAAIETQNKPAQEVKSQTEEERRAAVRRRWRILGMKVRVGITANIVKRRKMGDANSFVVKETEKVNKEDEMDLEGACKRKTKIKSKYRKVGFGAGNTQGRMDAW